jgi:hypothetical protein
MTDIIQPDLKTALRRLELGPVIDTLPSGSYSHTRSSRIRTSADGAQRRDRTS